MARRRRRRPRARRAGARAAAAGLLLGGALLRLLRPRREPRPVRRRDNGVTARDLAGDLARERLPGRVRDALPAAALVSLIKRAPPRIPLAQGGADDGDLRDAR